MKHTLNLLLTTTFLTFPTVFAADAPHEGSAVCTPETHSTVVSSSKAIEALKVIKNPNAKLYDLQEASETLDILGCRDEAIEALTQLIERPDLEAVVLTLEIGPRRMRKFS